MCCRHLRFTLCFVLAVFVCSLSFICAAADLDEGFTVEDTPEDVVSDVGDFVQTMDELCRLVGVDPEDEEAVDRFLVWMYDLPELSKADFGNSYLDQGYIFDGMEAAYFTYCRVHEFEPDTLTVVKGDGYTQYRGEDVQLTYISSSSTGYPAGTWMLGTTGKTGTNGYFGNMNILNITEIKEKVQNVLTDANLEKLEKSNEGILQYVKDYLPNLSDINTRFQSVFQSSFDGSFWALGADGKRTTLNHGVLSGFSQLFYYMQDDLMFSVANGFQKLIADQASFLDGSWNYGYWQVPDGLGQVVISSPTASGNGLIGLLGEVGRSINYNLATLGALQQDLFMGNQTQTLVGYSFDEAGNLVQTPSEEMSDVAAILVQGFENVQRDTASLRYVLANDDDIRLKAENKPMQDAVEDGFTGNGGGAASVDDIKNAADITAGMKDLLAENPVSIDDFFSTASDTQNYNFFSQQTADQLDTVRSPAAVSVLDGGQSIYDQWLEGYTFDEDGFVVPDMTGFSISSYLQGVS